MSAIFDTGLLFANNFDEQGFSITDCERINWIESDKGWWAMMASV